MNRNRDRDDEPRSLSDWNVSTLHQHIVMLINERDRLYAQRFEGQLAANQKALEAAQKAIDKSEMTVEKRLENTNEWRAAMNDRDHRLLPRQEFDSIMKEWAEWRGTATTMREGLANRITAIETRSVTWAAAISLIFIVVQIAIFFFKK